MSYYFTRLGRAGKLVETLEEEVAAIQGCIKGSAEDMAKNNIGHAALQLCKSLPPTTVVRISMSGSASNADPKGDTANYQTAKFEFETIGHLD